MPERDYAATVQAIRNVAAGGAAPTARLQRAMELIQARHPQYEWVGIYLLRGGMLELGPYVGAPTDHTRIPVGRGVCGTAVAERANQVIEDVLELDNYLACSSTVRSEIVVLIWEGDTILGQMDVDCDEVGAFGPVDEAFLTQVAAILAPLLKHA